jgi:hypothetical protein
LRLSRLSGRRSSPSAYETAYIAKVKTGAPEQIVSKASIIMMQDGKPSHFRLVAMASPVD